jgi:hypothetical protein
MTTAFKINAACMCMLARVPATVVGQLQSMILNSRRRVRANSSLYVFQILRVGTTIRNVGLRSCVSLTA